MDGEANRQVLPDPPPSSNLVLPVLNADSTSLSASQPDFLGHFKAAFKRHRPLGTMPVNSIRPKRLVGSQHEASRTTSSNVIIGSVTGTKNFDDTDLLSLEKVVKDSTARVKDAASVVKTRQECVSISPPSISGITFEDDFDPLASERDRSKYVVADKDIKPILPTQVTCEQVEGERQVLVSTAISATSIGAESRMVTGLENLSSHMGSLALTELEQGANKQAESLTAINIEHKHQNKEAHANLRSDAAVSDLAKRTSLVEDQLHQLIAVNTEQENQNKEAGANLRSDASNLAKRTTMVEDQLHQLRNFLGQPATQYSAIGLLGATTTSVHSTAAPTLNSATCCPRPQSLSSCQVAPESLGDFIMDSQHMRQGNMQQQVQFSSKHESGALNDGRASTSQTSTAATSDQIKEHRIPSKKECNLPKEIDIPKNPSNVNSKLDDERGSVVDAIEVQSQDLSSKNTCSDAKLVPSKQEIQEKVSVSKGASGPRKRSYDPDLFFKVNGKLYQRLGKIGSGGSSEVHKVISSDCKIYALKKIKLKGRDYATAYGFCQEIEYLNRLKGKKNIIELIDYEVTDKYLLSEVMSGTTSNKDGRVKDDGYIYMVLEYGEVDLAHMLSQKWKEMEGSNQTIDENWLRFYWQQILQAVNTIHEERIVHSDLKPANFLLVKGSLKLIDFGIAKAIMSDTTNIQRDSQVGTLSYMSPEAFMCNEKDANGNTIKCGRPSDIWSLGCILYQMVYGRTPFQEYKTFWAKFKVITDPNHKITYEPVSNPWLLDLMKKCLAWDRNERWRIPELLKHPFLVPPSGSNLLQSIAEALDDDQEASALCSELQWFLSEPVSSSLSRDEQCKLLQRISNLSSQLHESLQKPKNSKD